VGVKFRTVVAGASVASADFSPVREKNISFDIGLFSL
jgi:hypothetical protein